MVSYLAHLSGIAALLTWIARWESASSPVLVQGSLIKVGLLVGQRFAIGVPKKRRFGRHPFLGVQTDERVWIERIAWDRAIHIPSAQLLVLVSKPMRADGTDRVDLPAFALVLEFDDPRKLAALVATGRLEARGMWFDDAGAVRITQGACLLSLPISSAVALKGVLSTEDLENHQRFSDLMEGKIARTNQGMDPGYKGKAPEVDASFEKMLRPFRAADIDRM